MGYLGERPSDLEAYLVARFRMETEGDFAEAAEAVAGESSIGTWTDVVTSERMVKNLEPVVYDVSPPYFSVAYPVALFEFGNLVQLYSSVAGNVFGMKSLVSLRLEDVRFPRNYVAAFSGPAGGIAGFREVAQVMDRPLLGTIVKPKVGLKPEDHAEVAFEAWLGGCDVVKDDENLTSLSFSNFYERVEVTLRKKREVESLTGSRKIYLPNVSAEYREMTRRLSFVAAMGGEAVMVDVVTVGWSALQSIVRMAQELGLLVHAHRAMHAAFTRSPVHGISMFFLAKTLRLAGVDSLHVGTGVGKMEGAPEEVKDNGLILTSSRYEPRDPNRRFYQEFGNLRPALPVASGGVYPRLVPDVVRIFGKDVLIQAGGGVHGHPSGTKAGAKAMLAAIEAAVSGDSLENKAKECEELKEALERW